MGLRVALVAGDHQVHRDMVDCPPAGVWIFPIASTFKEGAQVSFTPATRGRDAAARWLARRPTVARLHLQRKARRMRRALVDAPSADLVHVCGQLLEGQPWVGDYEHGGALYFYQP